MKAGGLLLAVAAVLFGFPATGTAADREIGGLFQGWKAVGATELAAERGGESPAPANSSLVDMGADVRENVVLNSTSGDNRVDGGAFSGAYGFSTVIQNSGNHVIIQDSTIVNLTIEK